LLVGGGNVSLSEGRLADVAPTLLKLMRLPQPAEMSGVSLLHRIRSNDQKSLSPSTSAME
jgi:bisphosphoglycerate-independent phosphoglycerate mutase (AlkP superfamily)